MKWVVILVILFEVSTATAVETFSIAENKTPDAAAPTSDSGPPEDVSSTGKYPSLDSLTVRHQPYLENISAYKPMYFLVGTDPGESKFQFSFKYRFFNTQSQLAQKLPLLKGIHFAYTQTSFWDLASDSQPFQDTSYKPELFFISSNIDTQLPGVKGLFVQTGLEHESNGKSDEDSRGANFLYFNPIMIFYSEKQQVGLALSPRMWIYIKNDENNQDLSDYRGYFDLACKLGKEDSLVLASSLRWAEKGGSIQVDLTYPLNRLFSNIFDIYLSIQYVNGLAENLLYYKERTEALRIGFAIVR